MHNARHAPPQHLPTRTPEGSTRLSPPGRHTASSARRSPRCASARRRRAARHIASEPARPTPHGAPARSKGRGTHLASSARRCSPPVCLRPPPRRIHDGAAPPLASGAPAPSADSRSRHPAAPQCHPPRPSAADSAFIALFWFCRVSPRWPLPPPTHIRSRLHLRHRTRGGERGDRPSRHAGNAAPRPA